MTLEMDISAWKSNFFFFYMECVYNMLSKNKEIQMYKLKNLEYDGVWSWYKGWF